MEILNTRFEFLANRLKEIDLLIGERKEIVSGLEEKAKQLGYQDEDFSKEEWCKILNLSEFSYNELQNEIEEITNEIRLIGCKRVFLLTETNN